MPKEIIASTGAAGTGDGFHAKVGWTRDRSVQIGMEGDDGRSLFWLMTGCAESQRLHDQERMRLGDAITAAVANAKGPTSIYIAQAVLDAFDAHATGFCSSVWADLDREGCNRLIRALRKARDAAYGRDE